MIIIVILSQANPISCAACLESTRLLEGGTDNTWFDPRAFDGLGGMKPSFLESDIRDVSLLPGVKGVMSLGSVLSIELKTAVPIISALQKPPVIDTEISIDSNIEYETAAAAEAAAATPSSPVGNARYYNTNVSAVVVSLLKQNNVYARPLGNVVYLMPTPLTPVEDRQRLIRVVKR